MRPAFVLALLAACLGVTVGATAAPHDWEKRAPMPVPRTEVSAAAVGREIVVLGGLTSVGGASRRVDAYSPERNLWRRLADLPIGVHHAMAVGAAGRLYVLGGYTVDGTPLRAAFVLRGGRWRSIPRMPFPRAAAGAGVVGPRIVVAGGIGESRRLARNALSFDLHTKRWSVVVGPTPREHLGVASLAGTVYAVGGRTAGLDTNLLDFESYRPGDRTWRRLSPVPDPRGGTGAAALGGIVVSVGGEEPSGTIAEVLAYRVAERRWVQLEDLPTPRHGVGVAALGGRVFVIGGGPEPGLTVSSANESLRLGASARRYPSSRWASVGSELTFRRPDGSRIVFSRPARAWCGASNTDEPTRSLNVAVLRRDGPGFALPFWQLQAVVRDAQPGRTIRFPLPAGSKRPRGAELFVADPRTRIEASSEEEKSRGRITFLQAGCKRGSPVRFTVTGVLGSEFFQGKPVRVSGSYRGVIGERPAWWPG